jgi:uncharacterized oxidoreductase
MEFGSNTVLVTGGASGIGLALAERFLRAGSDVIVCGRREEKLREAKEKHSSRTPRSTSSRSSRRRSIPTWEVPASILSA